MKSGKILCLGFVVSLLFFTAFCPKSAGSEYQFGELTDLAEKYRTDKGYGHHYTEVYEYFFYPVKYDTKKILEIGIAGGASLKMWRDYFPNAVIYGIDINDESALNSPTIKTFIADQSDRKKLQAFIDAHGDGFDIILDDGGHSMEQQQISFGYFFKYLKSGGYYIIEDMHTSIFAYYHAEYGALPTEDNTTLTMVNNFVKTGGIDSKYMLKEESDYLNANIVYCNMLSRDKGRSITCIFKKKK